jgi:hypothetical protein
VHASDHLKFRAGFSSLDEDLKHLEWHLVLFLEMTRLHSLRSVFRILASPLEEVLLLPRLVVIFVQFCVVFLNEPALQLEECQKMTLKKFDCV